MSIIYHVHYTSEYTYVIFRIHYVMCNSTFLCVYVTLLVHMCMFSMLNIACIVPYVCTVRVSTYNSIQYPYIDDLAFIHAIVQLFL